MTSNVFAGTGFQLDSAPLLSRSTVDRREQLRDASDGGAELWATGKVLLVDAKGRTRIDTGSGLVVHPACDFGERPAPGAVLLGVEGETSYWALRSDHDGAQEGWLDLRNGGGLLNDTDAGLFTTAVGLLSWHDNARYCAVCGAATTRVRAGWARRCTGCDREEYPRTDPAVICLVHDGGDQVLLARQPNWPPERYSVLAGFVEVGESLEACVAREIAEEVGVDVSDVRYLGSQPWPFPRSLMLGFAAIADPSAPLVPADGEIEDARWVHRDTVLAALQSEGAAVDGLRLPPGVSIAYRMIRGWATWQS
ncbi:NAD+ diphosphatase [Saccharopolyspora kobensis]|uniref:NAD(+) diphosphatase n=1 Tax=Saccharopolyspora kobensis TaxID=146035 RepID=A0A1H6CWE2_9PSEU|nr:NAD(+) diphosphatase [Saccharopolyspora kobensis]SEG77350.1 NAD+ diphosphatase [Saccharopolyspora kobensis]SFD02087.1 NAD+ diphosphatase [Saccharopolyspora kobensis]